MAKLGKFLEISKVRGMSWTPGREFISFTDQDDCKVLLSTDVLIHLLAVVEVERKRMGLDTSIDALYNDLCSCPHLKD